MYTITGHNLATDSFYTQPTVVQHRSLNQQL